jgi:putative colanic acid biosysnthesis UDP-glucose lipid carrier transferase
MYEPVVFKNEVSQLLAIVRATLPAAVAVGCLVITCWVYEAPFGTNFVALSMLVAAMAAMLLKSSVRVSGDALAQWGGIAIDVISRWLMLFGGLLVIAYVTKFSAAYPRRVILTWTLVTPAVLIIVNVLLRAVMRRIFADPANSRRVIFAGYNDSSLSLATRLKDDHLSAMKVDGFFDDRSAERLGAGVGPPLLGKLPDMPDYVKSNFIDVIFVALPIRHIRRVLDLIEELRDTTASIYYIPDILVFDLIQSRTMEILGIPVIAMCETPFAGYRGVVKRLTDIVLCMAAMPLLLPLMGVISVAVKTTSPGPAIFRQRRYGLDGRPIVVYKFRTMDVTEDGDVIVQATKDDARVTPVGRFLRRYSLDEFPQFFNVLQGRMSLVGPRPHAVAHNEWYRKLIKGYMVRHKVPPGITGLAQINGCRGETALLEQMQARIDYDLEYLRHWSLMLDLKILARTVLRLVRDANRTAV